MGALGMTPYQQAQALYMRFPELVAGRTLQDDIALHVTHGFVWSSPTAIILAKLTHSSYNPEQVARYWLKPAQADCWFVYLAAGDLREFFRVAPLKLPFACFYRRGKFRRYPLDRLEKRSRRG